MQHVSGFQSKEYEGVMQHASYRPIKSLCRVILPRTPRLLSTSVSMHTTHFTVPDTRGNGCREREIDGVNEAEQRTSTDCKAKELKGHDTEVMEVSGSPFSVKGALASRTSTKNSFNEAKSREIESRDSTGSLSRLRKQRGRSTEMSSSSTSNSQKSCDGMQHVAAWICGIGLEFLIEIFAQHGLDALDLVSELTDADLVSLVPAQRTSCLPTLRRALRSLKTDLNKSPDYRLLSPNEHTCLMLAARSCNQHTLAQSTPHQHHMTWCHRRAPLPGKKDTDFDEAPQKTIVSDGDRPKTTLAHGAWVPGAWSLSQKVCSD
jgi:hypothetical protein